MNKIYFHLAFVSLLLLFYEIDCQSYWNQRYDSEQTNSSAEDLSIICMYVYNLYIYTDTYK